MAKKTKKEEKQKTGKAKLADDSKLFAFLATFLSIIGFILVLLLDKKKDRYVMYYAKQSLVVFITGIIVSIAGLIIGLIPVIGWIIMTVAWVLVAVLWLISWINALSGETKETPVVGSYADKIKL